MAGEEFVYGGGEEGSHGGTFYHNLDLDANFSRWFPSCGWPSFFLKIFISSFPFQLSHFPDLSFVNNGEVCNATRTFPEWVGIKKETDTWQLLGVRLQFKGFFYKALQLNSKHVLFQGMVVAIVALALQSVVVYRQRHYRRMRGIPESSSVIAFEFMFIFCSFGKFVIFSPPSFPSQVYWDDRIICCLVSCTCFPT